MEPVDKCRSCGQIKTKIPKGTSPNGKRRYYEDECGKKWRGKICPECSKKRHTDYIRNYRKKEKNNVENKDNS